jgi:hypothetical protein
MHFDTAYCLLHECLNSQSLASLELGLVIAHKLAMAAAVVEIVEDEDVVAAVEVVVEDEDAVEVAIKRIVVQSLVVACPLYG